MSFLSAEENNWILACEKFSSSYSFYGPAEKDSSVSTALETLLPSQILDHLVSGKVRVISDEEDLARKTYKLKNDRISLFLQLESAVKSRDAFVLQNLSESALKNKLKAEDKKIQEIREKIRLNMAEFEEAERKAAETRSYAVEKKQLTEGQKYLNLFKGLVTSEDKGLSEEKVSFYGSGESHFISATPALLENGRKNYSDREFVKQMQSAKISGLLTGNIKIMDDFMQVTADLYLYPLGKSVFTVTEVGSVSDIDFVARSIANSLSPVISSSMPVTVNISVGPDEALGGLTFVIDDVVYTDCSQVFTLDSGVHSIRFDSPGFRTVSTSYFFNGNESYNIAVDMKKNVSTSIKIKVPSVISGSFTVNGEPGGLFDEEKLLSTITVNDNEILGSFTSEDGGQGFFFVPEKKIFEGNEITIKPALYDKSEFIDHRRKMMYTSYSVFLCSLIGTLFTYGNYSITRNAYILSGEQDSALYKEAKVWGITSIGTVGITACAGGWFAVELARYLKSGDSVLPVNGK